MKTTMITELTSKELEIIQTALEEYSYSYKKMFEESPEDFDEAEINLIRAHVSRIEDLFEFPFVSVTSIYNDDDYKDE